MTQAELKDKVKVRIELSGRAVDYCTEKVLGYCNSYFLEWLKSHGSQVQVDAFKEEME